MVAVTFTPLFGVPVGPEVLVILLIAILLFGANKIPELARSSGEAIGEFQKGREQVEQELEEIRQGADPTDDDFEDTASVPETEPRTEQTTETTSETESETDEATEEQ